MFKDESDHQTVHFPELPMAMVQEVVKYTLSDRERHFNVVNLKREAFSKHVYSTYCKLLRQWEHVAKTRPQVPGHRRFFDGNDRTGCCKARLVLGVSYQAYSSVPSECYSIPLYLDSTSLAPSPQSEDRAMLHDTLLFLSVSAPEISNLCQFKLPHRAWRVVLTYVTAPIHPSWRSLTAPRPNMTSNQCDETLGPPNPCNLSVVNDDTFEPPAMVLGSVPSGFPSEITCKPVTPVLLSSELPSPSLPPVPPVFSSSEVASPSPPPVLQASSFANEAEYNSQSACIDPSLLNIAPSAPATNANLTSSPGPVQVPFAGQMPVIPLAGQSHIVPAGGLAPMGPVTGSAHMGLSTGFDHATKYEQSENTVRTKQCYVLILMLNLEVLALQTLYLTLFLPGNTCLSSNLSTKPQLSRRDAADELGNLLLDNESESYEQVVDGMELQSMVNVSEEVEAEGRGSMVSKLV
ncbi:hypothetical protein BD769DRAFT_1393711 [Suillus cothurnatus]|nr:hypothetical protein BD769DRAFT_1393711 [Suillus cothurnatus]